MISLDMSDQNTKTVTNLRKIIHIDMDAFFASVEQLDNPGLKDKPVIVGGNPNGRGVVAAASYEARSFGVRSAMPSRLAKKLCPQAIFVKTRFSRYKEISQEIRKIFYSVTDLVEPLSLDEAYLDVTNNKLKMNHASEIAKYIKQKIYEKVGLTASAGVGPNKLIAKIASDYNKPNGLTIVPPEKIQKFLDKMPVEKLFGVGPKTKLKLNSLEIKSIDQLKNLKLYELESYFGTFGKTLFHYARGIDQRSVKPFRLAKSIGKETTFKEDKLEINELTGVLETLIEEVLDELNHDKLLAKTITIKVRFHDFQTLTRSMTFNYPSNDEKDIQEKAKNLLYDIDSLGHTPIRLIGFSVKIFYPQTQNQQLQLNFDQI